MNDTLSSSERLQAEEALRAERARLELLLDCARALSSTLDRAGILHTLAARLISALNAAGASFTEINHTTGTIHSPIHHVAPGRSPLVTNEHWEPLNAYPVVAQVVQTRAAWSGHVDDPDFPPSERAFLLAHGMRTEVLVPIVVQDQVSTMLGVYWDSEERITSGTVAVCTAIADQASVALENARLYAAEADLRSRAEVRAHRLEHVQRVGERLKADLDEHAIGQRVVEATRDALGFRMVVLNLVDEPDNPAALWRVIATVGIPPEGIEVLCANAYTVAAVQDLFRPVFRVSRSYFFPEESELVHSESEVPRWRWTPQARSDGANAWHGGDELLVPLSDTEDGRLIGFLSVSDPENGQRPEREDIEVLEIFADQTVVALRNARLLARAREQAQRDHVTSLFNHRAAHARLESELMAAHKTGVPLSVLTLDMDGFKLINDTYGHATGDLALRHVADLLGRCARANDTAARLGGDEFMLILPGATQTQTEAISARLIALAHEVPLHIDGTGFIPLRLSIGVATCPADADQAHTLLAVADMRLYEAKRSGGQPMETRTRTRTRTETGERRAAGHFTRDGVGLLTALVTAVDNKDAYTRAHSEQAATLACALAEALGLSCDTQRALRLAGLLHNAGMIGVPNRVLHKQGRLDPDEWEAMKQHAALSAILVRTIVADPAVVEAVAHHHERWDGAGYPAGLAGTAVPLPGRIMAIADAAAAMSLDRPYRKRLARGAIIAELRKGSGTQFDPALVEPFIAVFGTAHLAAA